MIRNLLLSTFGLCIAAMSTASADEPCAAETVPARGRMDIPFSRIVHHNRPFFRRLGAWMCSPTQRAPRYAQGTLFRPVDAVQPPLYAYFWWMRPDEGACHGCHSGIAEPQPSAYLVAPAE